MIYKPMRKLALQPLSPLLFKNKRCHPREGGDRIGNHGIQQGLSQRDAVRLHTIPAFAGMTKFLGKVGVGVGLGTS